jgi:hypothetical protein
MDSNLTVSHVEEDLRLWNELNNVHLREKVDNIVRNLTSSGEYSTTSAYNAQFLGNTHTWMNKLVWKIWVHPIVKINRVVSHTK